MECRHILKIQNHYTTLLLGTPLFSPKDCFLYFSNLSFTTIHEKGHYYIEHVLISYLLFNILSRGKATEVTRHPLSTRPFILIHWLTSGLGLELGCPRAGRSCWPRFTSPAGSRRSPLTPRPRCLGKWLLTSLPQGGTDLKISGHGFVFCFV